MLRYSPERMQTLEISSRGCRFRVKALLGGSWVVLSGVGSKVTIHTTPLLIRGLTAPHITAHEPPSSAPDKQRSRSSLLQSHEPVVEASITA